MDSFTLDPAAIQVESYATTSPDPAIGPVPTGMKTWEPGCTTPDLCPIGTTTA